MTHLPILVITHYHSVLDDSEIKDIKPNLEERARTLCVGYM